MNIYIYIYIYIQVYIYIHTRSYVRARTHTQMSKHTCTQGLLEDTDQGTPNSKRQKLTDGGKSSPIAGKLRGKKRHHVFPDVELYKATEMVAAVYCLAASARFSKVKSLCIMYDASTMYVCVCVCACMHTYRHAYMQLVCGDEAGCVTVLDMHTLHLRGRFSTLGK